MAYSPQNNFVFAAAYAGVMAATTAGNRVISDAVIADYGGLGNLAGSFAQSFDTAWGSSTVPSWTDLMMIQSFTQSIWQDRQMINQSTFLTPATFTVMCKAIIAAVGAADSYFAAQGITAPVNPGTVSSGITQLTGAVTAGPGSGSVVATIVLNAGATVTGVLPAANQANQALLGDVTGNTGASTVAKINGSSVPAGGALTTGNVLQVTGVSALGYAAVNLAGGANFVTGTLPTGNQANQAMGGDTSGTTNNVTVTGIQTNAVPSPTGTGTVLTWNAGSSGAFSWATASSGGLTAPVTATTRTKTANYTLDSSGSDYQINADTNSVGAWTLTLVAPANGRCFVVIDVKGSFGTNNLTLAPHGAELINGVNANKVLSANWGVYNIYSDGTNWYVN